MGTERPVIGIWDAGGDQAASPDRTAGIYELPAEAMVAGEGPEPGAIDWADHDDGPAPRDWRRIAVCGVLLLLLAGWTALYVYASVPRLAQGGDLSAVVGLVSGWAGPALLVGIAWLLLIRGSTIEAVRFGAVARQLAAESTALERKMRSINGELVVAREFLTGQTRAMEALGRQSSVRLTSAAETLQAALVESEERARLLESVSEAAGSNMEHLRKQLPVIINSAKDVTNQIGNAGRSAQAEMNILIGSLKQVGENGLAVRAKIEGLQADTDTATERLGAATQRMEQALHATLASVGQNGDALASRLEAAFDSAADRLADRAVATADILSATATQTAGSFETSVAATVMHLVEESRGASERLDAATLATVERMAVAVAALDDAARDTAARAEQARAAVDAAGAAASRQTAEAIALIDEALARVAQRREEEAAGFAALASRLDDHAASVGTRIDALDREGAARTAELAFALEALLKNSRLLGETLDSGLAHADAMIARSDALTASARAGQDVLHALPASLDQLERQLRAQRGEAEGLRETLSGTDDLSSRLAARIDDLAKAIGVQRAALDALGSEGDRISGERSADIEALAGAMARAKAELDDLSRSVDGRLATALDAVRARSAAIGASAREAIDGAIADSAARLGDQARDALSGAIGDAVAEGRVRLSDGVAAISRSARDSIDGMDGQIGRIDALSRAVAQRLAEVDAHLGNADDEGFARRMALLTESLNSTAIDVAKILSNEVTDTAWAAYLKGDRGVFTRRAVRLLDAGEIRVIAQHYDEESDFREHVNRYIHDFEAMMRTLLGTRDGSSIGVTLLSSDVGKLYVALAQAIERLRA